MFNKKRKGFTLMEIVLVMVLIAILATGVAIGFTSYINKGHETGITTDYNSTFKNPIRMSAIEKGKLPDMAKLEATIVADGFVGYEAANAGEWQTAPTESATVFGVEKGNKRYEVELTTFDETAKKIGSGAAAIVVRADHSNKETTAVYVLNTAKNDVVTYVGTVDAGVLTVD